MSNTRIDRDAEAAVLGAILLKPELIDQTILTESSFYQEDLKLIFKTMLALRESGTPVDVINIVHLLGNENIARIGGFSAFTALTQHTVTSGHFPSHEKIVKENEFLRDADELYIEMQLQSHKFSSPKEYLSNLQESLETLEGKLLKENVRHNIDDTMDGYDDEVLERTKNGKTPGYPIISNAFDDKIGGAKKQDLIIIGARPSVGKTAFAVNVARNTAASSKVDAVLIISIEMKNTDIVDRIIAGHCRIEGKHMENGWLTSEEWQRYTHGSAFLRQSNILINDRSHQTVEDIAREIKAVKAEHENLLVIVDYLQEVQTERKFSSRREEVTHITRKLKQAARDNDCPVICISSLKRGNDRPTMADLKESGDIEFAADLIMLLHRDDYAEKTAENTKTYSLMEIIVDKNRKGWTGVHEMIYERNFSNFLEVERRYSA